MEGGEWLQADEVVQDTGRVAVVSSVVERRQLPARIHELSEPNLHHLLVTRAQRTHRFGQVPVYVRVVQVEGLTAVVLDDPWEHRVLVEVVERTAGNCVELHQVLKVRDLPTHPFVCQSGSGQ